MKILILGLSGSGKSSIAPKLAEKYNLGLIEADDKVMDVSHNKWPFDDKLIDEVFESTNRLVLNKDSVLYVISWLETERIKEFRDKGFLIIEMHADYEELLKRKIKRNGMKEWQIKRFEKTYKGYFETVLSEEAKKHFALSLDTTKIGQVEVFEKISRYMDSI